MKNRSAGIRETISGRVQVIFGIDLRTLALFRIMLALGILLDLALRARDLTAHYSDAGILPRAALITEFNAWYPSIHMMSGSARVQGILFLLAGVVALALLIGYKTRAATLVSWALLVSLQARSQPISQGGDLLLHLLLFWGIFLPLGARFSVDAALDAKVGKAPNQYFSMATMALLVQCMSVYFFTALLKDSPDWLPNGTAVYYALQIDYLATPFAMWLRQFPVLLQALTYFVWVLELVAPALMFAPIFHLPLRMLGLFLLVCMHIGFLLCLEIGIFPYVSITSLLVFTPGWVWDRIGERLGRSRAAALRIYYDEPCDFCRKVCLLLRTFLLPASVPIEPAQSDEAIHAVMREHNSWVVVDHDGSRHVRWDAVALVFRRSMLFAPIGMVFSMAPVCTLGDRIYEAIARNRGSLARYSAALLPYRDREIHPSLLANLVVAALMILVLAINVRTLPGSSLRIPPALFEVATSLRLNQKWAMFAPAPSRLDGWFVVRGVTAAGAPIDILNKTLGEPDWARPRRLTSEYASYRWRKYLIRMKNENEAHFQPYYARYLCRTWNRHRRPDNKATELSVYFNAEWVMPDYAPRKAKRVLVHTQTCEVPAAPKAQAPAQRADDPNEGNF